MRRPDFSFRLLAALLLAVSSSQAVAQTWRAASLNWSDPANWGGTLPTQDGTADLLFSQTSSGLSRLDQNWNIRRLTWNATTLSNNMVTLDTPGSGQVLTLQGGVNNFSGGRVEIYADLSLGALQTWNDATTPGAVFSSPGLFVYGAISGAGGIQKIGSGTIRLGHANSYSGGNVITGGVLEVFDSTALGTGPSVQIDGGTLRFAAYPLMKTAITAPQNLVLGSAGGTIQTRYGDTTLTGSITGAGGLRLVPDPSWGSFLQSRYTWAGTNDYAGGTVIGAVTVTITGAGRSLGTGGVTVQADGVLSLAADSNLAPGKKVALQSGAVLVLGSTAVNPANILDSTGLTTGGILSLGADYGTPLNMAALGNGQLFLGSTGSVNYTASTLGAGTGGIYRLGGGSGANDIQAPASVLTFSGGANLFTGASSVLLGTAGFQTSDARPNSKVVFQNANDYSGGTAIAGGTLGIGHDNALGTGSVTVTGSYTGLSAEGAPRTVANPLVFNTPANATFNFPGLQSLTLSGPVNLGGTTLTFFGSSARTSFTNTISNGTLNLASGTWSLTGANSFSGGLFLGAARLEFSQDANLGANGATVTFQGGVLVPTATVSTSRPFSLSSYGGVIDTSGQLLTLSGTFSGSGALIKKGAGTLIFSGRNISIFSLDLQEGLVRFDDTGTKGGVGVSVRSGATLGGNGSVGPTSLAAGAHLAPGTDTPGTFLFNSNLSLTGGALLDFDLGLTAFDEIILGHGTLENRNASVPAIVNISDAGGLTVGQTYTLIDWSAAAATVTPADFQLGAGPVQGNLAIVGSTLQFTATQVPEPTGLTLLAIAGCLLAQRRRYRSTPRSSHSCSPLSTCCAKR